MTKKRRKKEKRMILLNSQGLSCVPPARGEKGKKTGIEKNSEKSVSQSLEVIGGHWGSFEVIGGHWRFR